MIIDSTGASYMLYSLAHGVGHGAVITVVLSEKGWRATTATGPVYLAWSMYDLNVTHASKATLELDSAPTLELAHTCADGLFHEYMMLARRFGFFDCKHFIYAHECIRCTHVLLSNGTWPALCAVFHEETCIMRRLSPGEPCARLHCDGL